MSGFGAGWTQGPQGRPEGKELGYHPKKKRSKWEPDYDSADWRMIVLVTLGLLVGCGVVAALVCGALVVWGG